MRDVFDIYTIIFLALAVFIFLRLRSVLGQAHRSGASSIRSLFCPGTGSPGGQKRSLRCLIVTLKQPRRNRLSRAGTLPERWKGVAEAGSVIAAGLDAIAGADANFDGKHFLTCARVPTKMIVNALRRR